MEFKIIDYPDGQINVEMGRKGNTEFTMRIMSYKDLFILKSKVDVFHQIHGNAYKDVFIPCLFGQRSDRRFKGNESFGLKMITDFINSMNFERVEIFDPHSDVSLALINNSVRISSFEFVEKAVTDIGKGGLVLVSPDAGAYKKVFEYGEKLNMEVMAAVKHRSLDGTISLKFMGDVKDKNCLIVDDLLDGGFTFHVLGEKLKEQGAKNVYLYISHAYFNKGYNFTTNIDGFYCTNSVKDIPDEYVDSYGNTHKIKNIIQYKII